MNRNSPLAHKVVAAVVILVVASFLASSINVLFALLALLALLLFL